MRTERIDDHPALLIVLSEKGQQCAGTHVKAIRDGKTDQQDADQQPPHQFQCLVIQYHFFQTSSFNHGEHGVHGELQ